MPEPTRRYEPDYVILTKIQESIERIEKMLNDMPKGYIFGTIESTENELKGLEDDEKTTDVPVIVDDVPADDPAPIASRKRKRH